MSIKSSTKTRVFIYALIAIFSIIAFTQSDKIRTPTEAYETKCPEGMSDNQCLEFLRKESEKINNESSKLRGELNNVKFEQMSLNQRISYYNNKIAETENSIRQLELDIETKNVEVRILKNDIKYTEDHINTVTQEVNKLEDAIEKRLSISYQYSFISPLEMMLQTENLDNMLRKAKYLSETRKKDKEMLGEMQKQVVLLEEEEKVLSSKKSEVEVKLTEAEGEKLKVMEEKENLASQKSEQEELIRISKNKEAEYNNQLAELKKQQDSATKLIAEIIRKNFNDGIIPVNTPVQAGQTIGFQGHTGFAYGSHLHFESTKNPFASGYFTGGGVGGYVGSGSAVAPMDGAILTQGFHYSGMAGHSLDMVGSGGAGYNDMYRMEANQVCCFIGCVAPGWYSLGGEGTPVRAIKAGNVSAVHRDVCGGKYVIVDHGGGEISFYLHLR